MNIDLLVTPDGEAGLLCSENLFKKAVGAILDAQSGMLSFEFADMDHMDLNIPIEEEFFSVLDASALVHIGSVIDRKIAQAYQIPLMFLDDPYRADAFKNVETPKKPLAAFEYFVKRCVLGQPVHRDDAGDEDSSGCILGETMPSSLEFAPHLARRHTMEVAPNAAPQMNAPGMGMGGSSSSGGGGYYRGGSARNYDTSDDE
ncbi:MAG: hypothetical protein ACRBDL_06645 [Alphaproteobacteria bacterium]